MLKPGDYVRFIHAREEGRIIRAFGPNEWEIETTDGFRIPVMASEIVKVASPESTVVIEHEAYNRKVTGRQLAVIPFNDQAFDLYLVNDHHSTCLYSLYETIKTTGASKGITHGTLNPFTVANLYRLSWQQLQEEVQGIIQLCFYEPSPEIVSSPLEYRFKITGLQVLRSSQPIPLSDKKGYLLSLDQQATAKKESKDTFPPASPEITTLNLTAAQDEVDLHIEKLIPEHSTLNAAEMLRLQLDTFEKHLDLAIAHGRSEIIFIHGIGNGILKSELHKRLGRNKQVASFSDAKKEKFGYGATLVSLK
ncbi:MAG TPA: DUF2027 domain-containing protein [Cytophagaceae bacterium]|jgi:hypothetical protein|nr:DUF2027 domain-containing protein [Cytophagaceae bacterium]